MDKFRITVIASLIISFGPAQAADVASREFVLGCPDLNQVLTQTSATDGRVTFEICDVDLHHQNSPTIISEIVTQSGTSCTRLVDIDLDGRDAAAMALTQTYFADGFGALAEKARNKMAEDYEFLGEPFGIVAITATAAGISAWSGAGRAASALTKNAIRGGVIAGAAALAAGPAYFIHADRRNARRLSTARRTIDGVRLRKTLVDESLPVVDAVTFPLAQRALAEAVARTKLTLDVQRGHR